MASTTEGAVAAVGDGKISRQYEYLVTELESSDSSIASTIREVFESEKPEDHSAFLETLSRRLAFHNSKIVKMCSNNYALFSGSVSQLVNLCPDVGRLQGRLNSISEETARAIKVVEKNQNAFRKSVSSCQNIMKTRSAIEKCLPVLRMHSNLKKLLKNQHLHYHALKMLEELSTEVLPQIEEFSFSSKLKSDLTKCRNTIKAEVNRSFKSYLESAWANAKRIGCNAMKIVVHTTEQYKHQTTSTTRVATRSPSKSETLSALSHSKYSWESIDESLRNVEDVINFKDLFKCQLIFNTLEKDNEAFSQWYETHRRDQLTQLLLTGFGKECRREKVSEFFEQVIGFFIIESYVVDSNKRIVNWSTICATSPSNVGWWDETVAFVEAQLVDELPGKIQIVEDLKYLKEIVLLFCHTAENLSLPSPKLKQCAFNLRHAFVNKLNEAFLRRFVTILWKEVYSPIVLSSPAKLREVRKIFPLDYIEAARGKCEVGKTLPFSESVPKIYFTLKEFVTELLNFCAGYQFNTQVIEEYVIKSLDNLIQNQLKETVLTLMASFEERAQKPKYLPADKSLSRGTLNFGELSQLSLNCECLSESIPHLATFIAMSKTNLSDPRSNSSKLVLLANMDPLQELLSVQASSCKLNAASTLTQLAFDVQSRMRDDMKFKIDAIMELVDYNWTTDHVASDPSVYATEVTSYLKNVRLTNKKTQSNVVAVTTYMEACKHIAKRLKAELVEPHEISLTGLKNFDWDLEHFQNFTAQLEFPPGDAETLRIVFSDLRQLVGLIVNQDFAKFVDLAADPAVRRQYNRVRREELLSLLEKIFVHEDSRKRTVAVFSRSSDRDMRRSLENAIRDLKSQIYP